MNSKTTDDLLVSLRKYTPQVGRDPIENFITEAFSWIINNNRSLANLIIDKILGDHHEIHTELKCNTQVNFNGVYPDMLIEFNDEAIIFEHKVWTDLHENQINSYRSHAEKSYSNSNISVALITATPAQHTSDSTDVNLCWSDIYEILLKWSKNTNEVESRVVVMSFLKLLKEEGLGPTEPVLHSSIYYYNIAKRLPKDIDGFLTTISKNYGDTLKSLIPAHHVKECRWGRYGFSILENWNPGLFIGFLLDEFDHNVKAVDGIKSPDFSLIVDFDRKYHDSYPNAAAYKIFKTDLKSLIAASQHEWDFYDISEMGKGQNRWHPLHIRVPMRKLFLGTETLDEQVNSFFTYLKDFFPAILSLDSLLKMRNEEFV